MSKVRIIGSVTTELVVFSSVMDRMAGVSVEDEVTLSTSPPVELDGDGKSFDDAAEYIVVRLPSGSKVLDILERGATADTDGVDADTASTALVI